jgi:hypothetical protein
VRIRFGRGTDEDAVEPGVRFAGHLGQNLFLRGRREHPDRFFVDADLLRPPGLGADIGDRGRVLPHQDDAEARRDALGLEGLDAGLELEAYFRGDLFAADDLGWHPVLLDGDTLPVRDRGRV